MMTEQSPLERAAYALERADTSEFHERQGKDYREMARAVLMAIREPSKEMVSNGARAVDSSPMKGGIKKDTETAWQAMIDAALEGEA